MSFNNRFKLCFVITLSLSAVLGSGEPLGSHIKGGMIMAAKTPMKFGHKDPLLFSQRANMTLDRFGNEIPSNSTPTLDTPTTTEIPSLPSVTMETLSPSTDPSTPLTTTTTPNVPDNSLTTTISPTVQEPCSTTPGTIDFKNKQGDPLIPYIPLSKMKTVYKNNELVFAGLKRPGSVLVVTRNKPNSQIIHAIRFDGEMIHKYTQRDRNEKIYYREKGSPYHYTDTYEKFPVNVTGAILVPDNQVLFFRQNKFCKRIYTDFTQTDGCSQWYDNRDLFGCNSSAFKGKDICLNPTIDGVLTDFRDKSYKTILIYKDIGRYIVKLSDDLVHGHISLDKSYDAEQNNMKTADELFKSLSQ